MQSEADWLAGLPDVPYLGSTIREGAHHVASVRAQRDGLDSFAWSRQKLRAIGMREAPDGQRAIIDQHRQCLAVLAEYGGFQLAWDDDCSRLPIQAEEVNPLTVDVVQKRPASSRREDRPIRMPPEVHH